MNRVNVLAKIREKAAKREGGITNYNVFIEYVLYYARNKFVCLSRELKGTPPTTEKISEIVSEAAEQVYQKPTTHISVEEYGEYINTITSRLGEYRALYQRAVRIAERIDIGKITNKAQLENFMTQNPHLRERAYVYFVRRYSGKDLESEIYQEFSKLKMGG